MKATHKQSFATLLFAVPFMILVPLAAAALQGPPGPAGPAPFGIGGAGQRGAPAGPPAE